MSIETDLVAALNVAKSYNSGSLVYTSGSTDVSCSVYKAYGQETQYVTDDHGYENQYLNYSVMAEWSDISSWGLVPKKSVVTLDGTKFLIGGVITYTAPYAWITLRYYDSSV